MEYYAKSPNASGYQQTVREHLSKVANLAEEFGNDCGLAEEAKITGLLHDFGKYTDAFQDVLRGLKSGINHAIGGGLLVVASTKRNPEYRAVIEAINGHHDGLISYEDIAPMLDTITHGQARTSGNSGKMPSIGTAEQFQKALDAFKRDFPEFRRLPQLPKVETEMLEAMLHTRMLFSCLVDADYSASAQNDDPNYLSLSNGTHLDPEKLLRSLMEHRDEIKRNSTADPELNRYRDEVFEQCGRMGSEPEGLFTLTAPTGLGKTLALLNFALRHCLIHKKKRIIIVLPFLTLAEQNARTYAEIIPDVLVDHSQSDLPETARELAARWSAPVIITTSVRFFEALFSDRPTVCRKLHSIANSVVVFDEAQSLPNTVANASLQAVNSLCRKYHTTMVFSTATQPDFAALPGLEWTPREILPENAKLFAALQRVEVDWRTSRETPLSEIAEEMAEKRSVCAIVNLRRHARELADTLLAICPKEEVFFLSTDLCPEHRSNVIAAIRQRLRDQLPCRVVSTQCIEAGVDLDFEVMYRALAPLDAMIQAAGRCNRNGRLDQGRMIVFCPEDHRRPYPSDWYGNAAMTVLEMNPPFSIYEPENIRGYYERLFAGAKDKSALRKAIESHSFADTAKEYKLIENAGNQVIVPYSGALEKYDRLAAAMRAGGITGKLLKEAAPLTVTCFARELEQYAERLPFSSKHGKNKEPQLSNIFILREQYREKFSELYSDTFGLRFQKESQDGYIF